MVRRTALADGIAVRVTKLVPNGKNGAMREAMTQEPVRRARQGRLRRHAGALGGCAQPAAPQGMTAVTSISTFAAGSIKPATCTAVIAIRYSESSTSR